MKKSLKNMHWRVAGRVDGKLDEDKILNTILANRGFTTVKKRANFLNPPHPNDLALSAFKVDPKSIKKAVKRIVRAVESKEKIVIYGDYDADGITATAILWEVLYAAGADVTPHIPDRFLEGYGINEASVLSLKELYPGLSLIITVDNGIVATKAIASANKLGIDVIITDHHEKSGRVPSAYEIVHTKKTSGSGISWLLARELAGTLKKSSAKAAGALELAAIGIVADQLALTGVNRAIVKHGIAALAKTKRVGLLSMFAEAGVAPPEVSTYTVGFIIAPRINAMGRLAQGIDSLRLLCTKSAAQAHELARLVGKTNRERQRVVENVVVHAKEVALSKVQSGFIVVSHESYHEGVIGLAASKLVEEYSRPAIVLAKGESITKASARSIPGVNIIKAISELADILESAGGHAMAAGFSLKTSDLEIFYERIKKVGEIYVNGKTKKTLNVDLEIPFEPVSINLVNKLKELAPFGQGNPEPVFATKKVEIVQSKLVGKTGDHIKLKLKEGERYIEGIAFGLGKVARLNDSTEADFAYNIEENVWNGVTTLQLNVRDISL